MLSVGHAVGFNLAVKKNVVKSRGCENNSQFITNLLCVNRP